MSNDEKMQKQTLAKRDARQADTRGYSPKAPSGRQPLFFVTGNGYPQ
jgi:hypothetical protein